jgi:hypothetical protein
MREGEERKLQENVTARKIDSSEILTYIIYIIRVRHYIAETP